MEYKVLIDLLVEQTEKQSAYLDLKKEIDWTVDVLVDACYSGSLLENGAEWVEGKGGFID